MSDDDTPKTSDVTDAMRASQRLWEEYHSERRWSQLEANAEMRRLRDERNTYRAGEALRRRRRP